MNSYLGLSLVIQLSNQVLFCVCWWSEILLQKAAFCLVSFIMSVTL